VIIFYEVVPGINALIDCLMTDLVHGDVLRTLRDQVSAKLEAQGVGRIMFQSKTLSQKDWDSIQSNYLEPIKAAEHLINVVIKESSDVYDSFMNALKLTDQCHVRDMIESESSYTGKPFYGIIIMYLL